MTKTTNNTLEPEPMMICGLDRFEAPTYAELDKHMRTEHPEAYISDLPYSDDDYVEEELSDTVDWIQATASSGQWTPKKHKYAVHKLMKIFREEREIFAQGVLEDVDKTVIGEDEVQRPWTFKAGETYIDETVKIKYRNQQRKQQRKALKGLEKKYGVDE